MGHRATSEEGILGGHGECRCIDPSAPKADYDLTNAQHDGSPS